MGTRYFLSNQWSHGWIELTEEEIEALADIGDNVGCGIITGDEAIEAVLSVTRPDLFGKE